MSCEDSKRARLRNRSSAERRELPWVEKAYVFDGPEGKETLADLFAGHSQLVVCRSAPTELSIVANGAHWLRTASQWAPSRANRLWDRLAAIRQDKPKE